MNPFSEDIKNMIEAESSLGLVALDNLFIGRKPSKPNDCVTIYDTDSITNSTLSKGEEYYTDAVQIRVRNTDYLTGWALINAIMLSLHGRAQETWSDTLYMVIITTSGPAMLTWDDNNRVIFIANLQCKRRKL